MKKLVIKHGNFDYELEMAKNAILVHKVFKKKSRNQYKYIFSESYNCPICNNSNTAINVICDICEDIERLASREYDRIITFGDYFPYGRMKEIASASDLSKAIMNSKNNVFDSRLLGGALSLYLLNYNQELLNYDYLVPVPSYHEPGSLQTHEKETIIAEEVHGVSKIPILGNIIIKTSDEKMKGISTLYEELNLAQRLYVENRETIKENRILLDGTKVLVIDDVIKKNVTVNRCAQILKGVYAVDKVIGVAPARSFFRS